MRWTERLAKLRALKGPSTKDWRTRLGPGGAQTDGSAAADGYSHTLQVQTLETKARDARSRTLGLFRLGGLVPARATDALSCSDGQAFELTGGAYACSGKEFAIATGDPPDGDAPGVPPDPTQPNPFAYVRVIAEPVPRLKRPPASVEDAAALDAVVAGRASKSSLPRSVDDIVERWLVGDYFAGIEPEGVSVGEWKFHRTSAGYYLRARDLQEKPLPSMHGELLGGEWRLPIAFVLEDTAVLCEGDQADPRGGDAAGGSDGADGVLAALTTCGVANKHARFNVADTFERGGTRYVRGSDGSSVPVDAVRLVDRIERPGDVPSDAKWVHVDLSKQALIAYEGDRPVYVTLVSSGREGYFTPTGLYRVERKYLTKTMRGKDIDNGRYYEVGEVPWTMYYDGNFAIHGAYWHNLFGKTKSHGCTNVPPVDARWLYYWSEPTLPEGWHAQLHLQGTWFYFSGESPPDGQ